LSTLERALRATLDLARFFAMIYLTYACMYLAPTNRVRQWGADTWLRLFRHGPAWPTEIIGVHGMERSGSGNEIGEVGEIGMSKEITILPKVLVDTLAGTMAGAGGSSSVHLLAV
jgi:hypothetical protein